MARSDAERPQVTLEEGGKQVLKPVYTYSAQVEKNAGGQYVVATSFALKPEWQERIKAILKQKNAAFVVVS